MLDNIKQSLNVSWKGLVAEARSVERPTMAGFLEEAGIELEDLYRGNGRSWLDLQRAAGWDTGRSVRTTTHWVPLSAACCTLTTWSACGSSKLSPRAATSQRQNECVASRRCCTSPCLTLGLPFTGIEASLARLLANRGRAEELRELSGVLHDRIHRVAPALEVAGPRPLHVHARYSRNEALAAFGMENLNGTFGSGVRWVPGDQADVFFVTLVKSEAHFSPTTMYADHAISPTVFQWESQSTTAEKSPTGQRYINHGRLGSSVHLFVRETKTADGTLGTPPYLYAGPMSYVSHTGERPMRILWRLDHALPADVFHAAKVA